MPRHSFSSSGGGPKLLLDTAEKVLENKDRFTKHGAVHMSGPGLKEYERKSYLGGGNLLNGAIGNNYN